MLSYQLDDKLSLWSASALIRLFSLYVSRVIALDSGGAEGEFFHLFSPVYLFDNRALICAERTTSRGNGYIELH